MTSIKISSEFEKYFSYEKHYEIVFEQFGDFMNPDHKDRICQKINEILDHNFDSDSIYIDDSMLYCFILICVDNNNPNLCNFLGTIKNSIASNRFWSLSYVCLCYAWKKGYYNMVLQICQMEKKDIELSSLQIFSWFKLTDLAEFYHFILSRGFKFPVLKITKGRMKDGYFWANFMENRIKEFKNSGFPGLYFLFLHALGGWVNVLPNVDGVFPDEKSYWSGENLEERKKIIEKQFLNILVNQELMSVKYPEWLFEFIFERKDKTTLYLLDEVIFSFLLSEMKIISLSFSSEN